MKNFHKLFLVCLIFVSLYGFRNLLLMDPYRDPDFLYSEKCEPILRESISIFRLNQRDRGTIYIFEVFERVYKYVFSDRGPFNSDYSKENIELFLSVAVPKFIDSARSISSWQLFDETDKEELLAQSICAKIKCRLMIKELQL